MRFAVFILFPLLLSVAACANQTVVAVQTASPELGCPKDDLTVQELEDDRYKVSGCSKSGIYQCVDDKCWREGWLARTARKRATREFACPARQVNVRWIQEETYRVEACGQEATYSCNDEGCMPEGARSEGPTIVPVIVVK